VVVDDSLAGIIATIPTMAIGEVVVIPYVWGPVPEDAGDLDNTAHAYGIDRQLHPAEDWDTWTVTKLVRIWGYKAADLNRDGVMGLDEPGLENWVIELTGIADDGEVIGPITRLTNTWGYYEFTNLKPGTYTVREILQTGWNVYSDESYDLTLSSGMVAQDVNFLNLPEGSICGYKWHDLNGDGWWDITEPAIEGWTIHLFGTDVNGDEVLLSALTDADGRYCFSGLIPGGYWVYENIPGGWMPTTDPDVFLDLTALEPFAVEVWLATRTLGVSLASSSWILTWTRSEMTRSSRCCPDGP
jgi:hypothetical protein